MVVTHEVRTQSLVSRKMGVDLGRAIEGEYNQNTLCQILRVNKNIKKTNKLL